MPTHLEHHCNPLEISRRAVWPTNRSGLDIPILGVGQTPVGKFEDVSIGALAAAAGRRAMIDAGITRVDAIFVGNMLASEVTCQGHLGPLVAAELGQNHAESIMVNAACGSGAAAVRYACLAIESGQHETVLAIGVEKMSGIPRKEITRHLTTAADYELEVENGATFVALNALLMQRYLHEYGYDRTDLAIFAEVAHENALTNPHARLRERLDRELYLSSRVVADPLVLYDCCPTGDGAAAVVLGKDAREDAVRITGSASASDSLSLQERANPLWLKAAEESCRQALSQAGRRIDEIDFFEPHDAFTVMTALSLEACGFTGRGRAPEFARDVGLDRRGALPICTCGGLKARGHPVGATGAYQIVEAALQLRHEAGPNQLPSPMVGLTQSFGGTGATALTHVLERRPLRN